MNPEVLFDAFAGIARIYGPSAAVALLWLRRSVAFNLALFRHK